MNKNIDIKNMKVAKRYAVALAESAGEALDEVSQNMQLVNETIFTNDDLKIFFSHPIVSLKDKKETIEEAFKDKISSITLNFLETLLDEGRFGIYENIHDLFNKEVDKIKNMLRADVTSAVEIEEKEKESLIKKLSKKLKKDIILNYNIDENIIGGLVVKIEDKVIDLSLKAKFENLKKL